MPDNELDPIPISSDTDYEQMEGSAGEKGDIDNVNQEICDEEMDNVEITTRDVEMNNYEISARDVSYSVAMSASPEWHVHAEVHSGK